MGTAKNKGGSADLLEIKFRAWSIRHKEMHYIADLYWFEEAGVHDGSGQGLYDDYVLMHGLRIGDGREAYDGDIIRYVSPDGLRTVYGVVKFGQIPLDFGATAKHIGLYIQWENDGANEWNEWWRHDLVYWLEDEQSGVIGNIHNNPELLKEVSPRSPQPPESAGNGK